MHYFNSIFIPDSTFAIISIVAGGLGLFLYGINLMSESLKALAGSRMKALIAKATGTLFKGILTGAAVTCLIQSSSATTVIVIGLISAGLMTFRQAIGVMMGANIGTTVTAFLIGLNVSDYSFLILVIGSVLLLFFQRKKVNQLGQTIFGFAALFVGLELMSLGLEPLADKPWFEASMISLSNYPILGVLVGTGLTALVQSSSASIGVLQQIFLTGAISLKASLPILIGCNIGTTITALLSSISGSREAKQAALFHLLFNFFGTLIFLIFLNPYTNLFNWTETRFLGSNNKLTIAFAHIFFNSITTILVLLVLKYFQRLVEKVLPVKSSVYTDLKEKLNEDLLTTSPPLALENAKARILEMGDFVLKMVQVTKDYFNEENENHYDECLDFEEKVDYYNHIIHDYLLKVRSNQNGKVTITQAVLMDTLNDLERIGDHCVNLVEFFKGRYEMKVEKLPYFLESINNFLDRVNEQVVAAITCFKTGDIELAKKVVLAESEIDKLERKYRNEQLAFICTGETTTGSVYFADILSNLERISDHCDNIAKNVINPLYMSQEITRAKVYLD
ncbi:MAG: Na/Pi cotransporter family protein [Bacilli bacterium]